MTCKEYQKDQMNEFLKSELEFEMNFVNEQIQNVDIERSLNLFVSIKKVVADRLGIEPQVRLITLTGSVDRVIIQGYSNNDIMESDEFWIPLSSFTKKERASIGEKMEISYNEMSEELKTEKSNWGKKQWKKDMQHVHSNILRNNLL